MNGNGVLLKKGVEEFNLTVAYASSEYDKVQLMVEEVSRPGLPLSGFFSHFERLRLQVIGHVEADYLQTLTHERKVQIFDKLFS